MKNLQVTGTFDHVVVWGQVRLEMSFAALNYPLNVQNDANKANKHCLRSLPSSSSSLSSVSFVPVSTFSDEMKNLPESQKFSSSLSPARSVLSQRNTVGIIGGVSVLSTLIFLEKLVLWSSRNGQDSVPFIVCSDPMLRQEAFKLSKTMANTTGHSNYSIHGTNCMLPALDKLQVVENLSSKRVFLEEGGAQCIVMPCHLSHAWHVEVSQGCRLPFLHVAECVARELKESRFKPLEAGSGVKVGVIAPEAILAAGYYQEELQKQGFEVVLPDRATMENIIKPAINCLKQKDVEGASNLLRVAIQVLLVRAANTVILASDELQTLLPHDDPLLKKCVDPLDALARSAVRWAKSAKDTNKHLHDL